MRTDEQPARGHRNTCLGLTWAITGQQTQQETQKSLVTQQPPPPFQIKIWGQDWESDLSKMPGPSSPASAAVLCHLWGTVHCWPPPQLVPFCSLADCHPHPRLTYPLGNQSHEYGLGQHSGDESAAPLSRK